MIVNNEANAVEVITTLLKTDCNFSVRVYTNGEGRVCEVFAKEDWCYVSGQFPRGVFDLDMDNRMNPIAKAVFKL